MNGNYPWLLLTLLLGTCLGLVFGQDAVVELREGGHLTGELDIQEDGELELKSYWMESSIRIPGEALDRIDLNEISRRPPSGSKVVGVDGSQFWLQDLELSESGVKGFLTTGEPIEVGLNTIQQVMLSNANRAKLQDVVDVQGNGSQALQRRYDVKEWPELFYLAVEIEESDTDPRFQLLCSGPNLVEDGRIMVRVDQNVVTVFVFEPMEKGLQRPRFVQVPVSRKEPVRRIQILGDLSTGQMQLKVGEGDPVGWVVRDPNLFQSTLDRPATLILQNERPRSPLAVSTLQLLPWEGSEFPDSPSDEAGLLLSNGESRTGTVVGISKELVDFLPTDEKAIEQIAREEVLMLSMLPSSKIIRPSFPFVELMTTQQGEKFHLRDVTYHSSLEEDGPRISGTLAGGARLEFPTSSVHAVQVPEPLPFHVLSRDHDVPQVMVTCLNGDSIQGSFLGIEDSSVRVLPNWPESTPVHITGAAVESLIFNSTAETSAHSHVFWLQGEGVLRGNLESLNEEVVVLDTAWEEHMVMDRDTLQRMKYHPYGTNRVSLLTPDFEGWTYYSEQFQTLKERPDVVRKRPVGWELKEGEYFVATEPTTASDLAFAITLSPEDWYGRGTIQVELRGFADLQGNERRIRVNLRRGQLRVDVYEQERIVKRWARFLTDDQREMLDLTISILDSSDVLQVNVGGDAQWELPIPGWTFSTSPTTHTVSIHPYDGIRTLLLKKLSFIQMPQSQQPLLREEDKEPGTIVFRNGDRMQADVVRIDSTQATLRLSGESEIEMPMNRISHLSLPVRTPFSLRRKASHARFRLRDGEEEFLAEVITATSEQFTVRREGILEAFAIPIEHVSMVDMNPYFLQ